MRGPEVAKQSGSEVLFLDERGGAATDSVPKSLADAPPAAIARVGRVAHGSSFTKPEQRDDHSANIEREKDRHGKVANHVRTASLRNVCARN